MRQWALQGTARLRAWPFLCGAAARLTLGILPARRQEEVFDLVNLFRLHTVSRAQKPPGNETGKGRGRGGARLRLPVHAQRGPTHRRARSARVGGTPSQKDAGHPSTASARQPGADRALHQRRRWSRCATHPHIGTVPARRCTRRRRAASALPQTRVDNTCRAKQDLPQGQSRRPSRSQKRRQAWGTHAQHVAAASNNPCAHVP